MQLTRRLLPMAKLQLNQDTEPIAEALGDPWVQTGEDNKLYRWSGSSRVVPKTKKSKKRYKRLKIHKLPSDGKIVTFTNPRHP